MKTKSATELILLLKIAHKGDSSRRELKIFTKSGLEITLTF
jgi:hypothetical protein